MDRDEALQTFIAITGATTASARQTAANILQATDYDLEQAANLFFASEAEANEPAQANVDVASLAGSGPTHSSAPQDDSASLAAQRALAQFLQNPASEASGQHGDYDVRAPDPSRRDMLYGETYRVHRRQGQQDHLDAFRDFRTEHDMPGSSGAEADKGKGLAELFKAPADLLHKGSVDDAYVAAKSKGCWLLINIQSNAQFATHQLNRDTWSNEMVRDIIKSSFVFWQTSDASEEGQKLISFYRLMELPAIFIMDPLTGQKMKDWAGFVDADRLLEDLVPFMDRGIHDSQPLHKRRSLSNKARTRPTAELSEEDQIAAAIAASSAADVDEPAASAQPAAQSASADAKASQHAPSMSAAQNEESAPAADSSAPAELPVPHVSPEPRKQTAAELEAAVPPEPPAGSADAICVAIRAPNGRLQRHFTADTPLKAVHDYCMLQEPDALAGKPFILAHAFPGGQELSDMKQTLRDANVKNSMLVMRWVS